LNEGRWAKILQAGNRSEQTIKGERLIRETTGILKRERKGSTSNRNGRGRFSAASKENKVVALSIRDKREQAMLKREGIAREVPEGKDRSQTNTAGLCAKKDPTRKPPC